MARSRKSSLKDRRASRSNKKWNYGRRCNDASNYINSPRSTVSQNSNGSIVQSFYDVVTYTQIPLYSWSVYFYNQEYDEKSTTVLNINKLIDFFERFESITATYDIEKGLNLDMNVCFKDSILLHQWPSIIEEFNANPRNILNCFCAAFFEVIMRRTLKNKDENVMQNFRRLQLIKINIINYEPIYTLSYLKLLFCGKLVSIGGIIINIGTPKITPDSVTYICRCKRQLIAKQRNETYLTPKKCNVCGNGRFKRILDSQYENMKISQIIQIKNHRAVDQKIDDVGITSGTVSVKLTHNLIDKFSLGDKVKIIGIPQMCSLGIVKSSAPGTCPLYIEAISVFQDDDTLCKRNITGRRINMEAIESIRSEPDLFSLLVHSLCPGVQGHELVKAALVLGLFSGKSTSNEIRDYIHLLIIGNLGVGKAQLLRASVEAVVQGVYIDGNSMISLEPTITKVRENGFEDTRLESGALNSANVDLCCIDELNRLSSQHQVLYNAMASRRVNFVHTESKLWLPACVPIFATINPIKRRYDPSKTVIENVNAYEPLLSQFDLVFLMRDHPDTYLDKLMCNRILDVHTNKRIRLSERSSSSRTTNSLRNRDCSLREQLVNSEETTVDILPQQLLRMYINYARLNINPEISNKSKVVIEQYILRQMCTGNLESVHRLLRTLITLTKARAKLDLRMETTERDVFDAMEIIEASISLHTKDRPLASSNNSSKLTANLVKQFLEDLRNEAVLLNKNKFTTEELHIIAGKENVTEYTLANLLTKLNEQGYLLKISSTLYKFVVH